MTTTDYRARYASAKTWPEYFIIALSDSRLKPDARVVEILESRKGRINYSFLYADSSVRRGNEFKREHSKKLEECFQIYGVAPNYVTAVLKLETNLGDFIGNHLVANSLYTISLFSSGKRGEESAKEFRAFLEFSMKNGWDPFSIKGSWAGAFGYPQFMPRSFSYAIDGNGDGIIDLFNIDDAIMSVGNFLKAHGWRDGNPLAEKRALWSYNKGSYADAVIKYAAMLKKTR